MSETGLQKAKAIYEARHSRIEQLKQEGHAVVGYLSIHTPVELIEAMGMVPCRISGDIRLSVTEADRGLPAAFCPFMRNILDLALKNKLGPMDGFVAVHACDAQEKTVRVISTLVEFPFTHFIDVPSTVQSFAIDFFQEQLDSFRTSLESFTGTGLSLERLNEIIELYNEKRSLIRELYELKKPNPPQLSGKETLEVVLAVHTMPVIEANELLREVIDEVRARPENHLEKKARLLVWGSVIDDSTYLDVVETSGGAVVIDDLDEGMRPFLFDTETTGDPMRALALKYLRDTPAARTFRCEGQGATKKDNIADLQSRYEHIGKLARDWAVDGVILQSVRYCDPHGYELIDVMDYVRLLKLPFIYVEHNYSDGALAPLRTRIEAFVETLE